jgi:uncharacterized protein
MRVPETEPEIGEPVSYRMRKWDGSPHRQTMMVYVGSDEFGRWLSIPTSLVEVRQSGSTSISRAAHVMLLPHRGCFLAHFNAPPSRNAIYADVTTAAEFGLDGDGWVITVVDMDLDVVRRADGRTWIEDEDEFAEHTVSYGYPADVVARTRATADALLTVVREELEPSPRRIPQKSACHLRIRFEGRAWAVTADRGARRGKGPAGSPTSRRLSLVVGYARSDCREHVHRENGDHDRPHRASVGRRSPRQGLSRRCVGCR